MSLLLALVVLSGTSFLVYGALCLCSAHMVREFQRFGLARFRVLTGTLEMLGGAGLLIGLLYAPLLCVSAFGLTVLMLLGVGVRLRVRDGVWLTLPAFLLLCVNGYLTWVAWVRLTQ